MSVYVPVRQRTKARNSKGGRNSRWPEELLQQHIHAAKHLGHEEVLADFVDRALALLIPILGGRQAEILRRGASGRGVGSSRDKGLDGQSADESRGNPRERELASDQQSGWCGEHCERGCDSTRRSCSRKVEHELMGYRCRFRARSMRAQLREIGLTMQLVAVITVLDQLV